VLAAIVLAVLGADKLGIVAALQITARFSFLLYWLAHAGGGLVVLVGSAIEPRGSHGLDFGLAFAAAEAIQSNIDQVLAKLGVRAD
jgi:hypothetical protein